MKQLKIKSTSENVIFLRNSKVSKFIPYNMIIGEVYQTDKGVSFIIDDEKIDSEDRVIIFDTNSKTLYLVGRKNNSLQIQLDKNATSKTIKEISKFLHSNTNLYTQKIVDFIQNYCGVVPATNLSYDDIYKKYKIQSNKVPSIWKTTNNSNIMYRGITLSFLALLKLKLGGKVRLRKRLVTSWTTDVNHARAMGNVVLQSKIPKNLILVSITSYPSLCFVRWEEDEIICETEILSEITKKDTVK